MGTRERGEAHVECVQRDSEVIGSAANTESARVYIQVERVFCEAFWANEIRSYNMLIHAKPNVKGRRYELQDLQGSQRHMSKCRVLFADMVYSFIVSIDW